MKDSKRFGQRIRQAMEEMRELLEKQPSNVGGVKNEKKVSATTTSTDLPA